MASLNLAAKFSCYAFVLSLGLMAGQSYAQKQVNINDLVPINKENISEDQQANKKALQELISVMPQFTANFKQQLSDSDNTLLSESRGKIYISHPNMFMMHTKIPDETALYTKDHDIYYYDSIVNQVSIYSIDSLGTNPLMLLTGSDPHKWDDYYVSRDRQRFTLIPKASKDFKSITISFIDHRFEDDNTYIKAIDSLSIRMDDGNTNFYLFTNQKNRVAKDSFDYRLPNDVEIDDQRQ